MIWPRADKVFVAERRLTYSIIIPVYNKWALTAGCLDALAATLGSRRADGQIIVVDDASSDETATALAARADVDCIIRHEHNTGFQEAASDGAAAASGDVLVFLNNDTSPQPGWLDALLDELEDPSVGTAGSMFLFPDGRVQEFGGIVWRDGSAYHIGAGLQPSDPLFSSSRDVDYVSGAGMAVSKALWEQIGGFDAALKPAYYEDTDFCMGVRAAGKRVVVTPRSLIVHIMGGSKDVDPRRSHDTMMSVNREKFRDKWKAVLDREHWPPHPYFIEAASHRGEGIVEPPVRSDRNSKRLLFVYQIVPQFDRQAGDRRLFEIMRSYTTQGHRVVLLSLIDDPLQAARLRAYGIEVWSGDKSLLDALGASPSSGIGDLEKRLADEQFDVVYLASPQIARLYLPLFRALVPESAVVTDAIDLNFHRMHRERLLQNGDVTALPLERQWELDVYCSSDMVISVSEFERDMLRASGVDCAIPVISTFYSTRVDSGLPFENRRGVAMVLNMAHHPNLDALRWFVAEIWPRVLALKPDIPLLICGNGTESIRLNGVAGSVMISGFLPSMDPVFRNARVNVAPLRFGAGVKGKVTEAMRNGLPTVTTPVGAEGIAAADTMIVESDPERLARAIVAVHEDEWLWRRLSAAGSASAAQWFSAESAHPGLQRILDAHPDVFCAEEAPSLESLAHAFSDPQVAIACFAAGARAKELGSLLRREPSVGALVGASDGQRLILRPPDEVPALIITRSAYQCARRYAQVNDIAELLSAVQGAGLVIAAHRWLPFGAVTGVASQPLVVDVTVSANAEPARMAETVSAVQRRAKYRLQIVPTGDLRPELPGEFRAGDAVTAQSDVRIIDGLPHATMIFGILSPTGLSRNVWLDPNEHAFGDAVAAAIERWSNNRETVIADCEDPREVLSLLSRLRENPHVITRAVFISSSPRVMQLAWASGVPATMNFKALPQAMPAWNYVWMPACGGPAQKPLAYRLNANQYAKCNTREDVAALAAVSNVDEHAMAR